MDLVFTGKFKSITEFKWESVPDFSIITGPNGVGKSQLLELINHTISPNKNIDLLEIVGEKFDANEIRYLTSEWNLGGSPNINLKTLQDKRDKLFQQFRSNRSRRNKLAPSLEVTFNQIKKELGKPLNKITKEEFLKLLPERLMTDHNQVPQEIGELVYDYRINFVEKIADGMSEDEFRQKFGLKPWDILDDILKESGLPFEFNNPENSSIKDSFQLHLLKTDTGDRINLNDLSSGEKVIVSLVFYLFNSQENKFFPKLLLLDEPDAHLHPSMTKQFLDVIYNVLVKKYSVKVIMTTHSPSTVALAPEESLFEMYRTGKRIRKSNSKNKTISLLTSGLVVVGSGAKYVLVEDEDDVNLYSYIYEKLSKEEVVNPEIPVIFIPASITNKSGGKSVVSDWVSKLQDSGLNSIIQGLVDRDYDDVNDAPHLSVLPRYSIENYYLDPLIIFSYLLDIEKCPDIKDIDLEVGEEYRIKSLDNIQLQNIADKIHGEVQSSLTNIFPDFDANENGQVEVLFTNGIKLKYPKWLMNRRGKDLMNLYRSHFHNRINNDTLLKAWKKLQMFPQELANTLNEIQEN